MWLLKAVYMYSVYLKFCKLKVKTVCVLKFTVYNVKDFFIIENIRLAKLSVYDLFWCWILALMKYSIS